MAARPCVVSAGPRQDGPPCPQQMAPQVSPGQRRMGATVAAGSLQTPSRSPGPEQHRHPVRALSGLTAPCGELTAPGASLGSRGALCHARDLRSGKCPAPPSSADKPPA